MFLWDTVYSEFFSVIVSIVFWKSFQSRHVAIISLTSSIMSETVQNRHTVIVSK